MENSVIISEALPYCTSNAFLFFYTIDGSHVAMGGKNIIR
jgi:hypothetical protein